MTKKRRYGSADLLLPLVMIGLILMVIAGLDLRGTGTPSHRVKNLSEGWYYIQDGVKTSVTLPAVIHQETGDALTLYYDGLDGADREQTVTTRAAAYRAEIYLGGELLYRYEDAGFPRNVQMASKVNCDAVLRGDTEKEKLSIVYQNTNDGVYRLNEVYLGDSAAVLRYHCGREAFLMVSVLLLAGLGVVTVSIALYLHHVKMREKRFMNSALFLLLCGVWFLTDSSLAQTAGSWSPLILTISFYAFMLLAVPVLYFVKNTGKMSKYRQIDVCIYAFYANAAVQSVLHILHIFTFVEMLFVTHLLLAGGVTLLLVLMLREYRESRDKELLMILTAFLALAAGGVSALVLYWLLEIPYYGVFFQCGILVFVALLIRGIIVSMVENLHFKTEMLVYQKMEKEDRLTGLKNRRAFDELIAELEQTADAYQDVVLVFLDLNHLKDINDRYGYGVGNEAIITAARCIERAYAPDGICFRIGGDEFCAVLPNETAGDEELFARLQAQLLAGSKNSRYRLTVAKGISRLRDRDGYLKTVSDWKREADLKMYENKGWVQTKEGYEGRGL